MVFYRKYRPQTLLEITGQQTVKQTLQKAYLAQKLAHAYLFCGPRGTGKTSTARILAKVVNCESQESRIKSLEKPADTTRLQTLDSSDLPCNTCSSCTSITDGSALDLIEIDAASNRGIDDIRDLREKIKLAPSSLNKKVYIIDEVHMLSNEAFNALLKTLEEPPAHVLFILATTDSHKIPQTILSRVQRLDFQRITDEDILENLKMIVEKEALEVEDQALKLIIKRSDGGLRDAQKYLDQFASSGEKITLLRVEEVFNSGRIEDVVELIYALGQKDTAKAIEVIEKQVSSGVNIKEFNSAILELLRQVLLAKHGVSVESEQIQSLSSKLSSQQVIKMLGAFQQSWEKLRYASIPSLPIEVAVIECCLEEGAGYRVEGIVITESVIARSESPGDEGIFPPVIQSTQDDIGIPTTEFPIPVVFDTESGKPSSSAQKAIILDKWNYILETIKPYNFSLEALLKQVKIHSCDDGKVVFEVPYSFHQRILEAPKSRDLLESVLSDVLGMTARVGCILGQKPIRIEEIANVEVAQDDEIISLAADIFNS